jgi:hypothetical protein
MSATREAGKLIWFKSINNRRFKMVPDKIAAIQPTK